MKIAVNTRLLQKGRMTGIELFTFETMSRIAAQHPEHTFYYIFDRKNDPSFITSDNIVPVVACCKSRYRAFLLRFWFEFVLPGILKKIQPDIFISPDNMMSLSTKVPTFLVIHDLGFEHFPEHLPSGISAFYRKYLPRYANKASRIATVSDYTKHDIVHHYNILPEKIDVVYNGADSQFRPYSEDEKVEIREKYCDGSPYFLFVGTIHPRKNLSNQLMAYDIFRKNNAEISCKFLIVGDRWIWDNALRNVYEGMKYRDDVVFAGRLSSAQLSGVIASAEALLYVSLFEGFGIPILEALYAETPVITANVSSMPEIASDAAICVDPLDPEAIAGAIHAIVSDPVLKEKLIIAGRLRRKMFSWDKTAQRLWESIEKIL